MPYRPRRQRVARSSLGFVGERVPRTVCEGRRPVPVDALAAVAFTRRVALRERQEHRYSIYIAVPRELMEHRNRIK